MQKKPGASPADHQKEGRLSRLPRRHRQGGRWLLLLYASKCLPALMQQALIAILLISKQNLPAAALPPLGKTRWLGQPCPELESCGGGIVYHCSF
ncbi:MAG: hypothetical protein JZU64_10500 [Rhodoferax sp.]|nr:hypothetical protein [Rhodoferax sp.]